MNYTLINHIARIETELYVQDYSNPAEFIKFCKQCNKYAQSWACPPFNFNPIETIQKYKHTYVIGTQVLFTEEYRQKHQSDSDIKAAGDQVMYDVRKLLDKRLLDIENTYSGTRAFYAGSCHLCPEDTCTRKQNKPCRYPRLIRPSLEAFGFDIGKTTSKLLNLELKWGKKGALPEYYILVSGIMTQTPLPNLDKLLAF